MKRMISILVLVTIVLFLSGCHIGGKKDVKLQIIEEDITTNKQNVSEEYNVKVGEVIALKDKQFYDCNREPNDVKIISIEDDYVVISREQLRYDTNNDNKPYTEEVTENIKYDEKFNTTINEADPKNNMACAQSKYSYYLMFVKK